MTKTCRRQGQLVYLGVVVALAVSLVTPAAAITWGEPDDGGHPNVGAMVVELPDIGWVQACSGTLISPHVFLTAGHCTDFAEALVTPEGRHVRVNFAEYALDFSDTDTWRAVEAVITHPQYGGPRSDPHDVGILILDLEAEPLDIEPAQLPPLGLLDDLKKNKQLRQGANGTDFAVVGYGAGLDWPPPETIVSDNPERQVAESGYRSLLPAWLQMSQNQATGDGGTGYGDSGGPAFWIDPENGDEILVGITSWGDPQLVSTAFDYRTDIPQTLDFVDAVLEDLAAGWLAPESGDTEGQGGKPEEGSAASDQDAPASKQK
jgi:hypothetical protein